MLNFLTHLLSSFLIVGALLEKPAGTLALRNAALLDTSAGKECCCAPPNCACCKVAIEGVLLEITGITNSPVYTNPGGTDFWCEGCASINRTILVPWLGDCTGTASFADDDSGSVIPPEGYDVDCYTQGEEDPEPIENDYYVLVTISYTWTITCDFDFETGLYTLTLTVELNGHTTAAGLFNLVRWEKVVSGLEEEEIDCTLLSGELTEINNTGVVEGDCDFSAASCIATVVEVT